MSSGAVLAFLFVFAQQPLVGEVQTRLLRADAVSCDKVKLRLRYLEKQQAEVNRLLKEAGRPNGRLDMAKVRELAALKQRYLRLRETVTTPWADIQFRFSLKDLDTAARSRVAEGRYELDMDLSGRRWTDPSGVWPDDVVSRVDGDHLVIETRWDAAQFCEPLGHAYFWFGG